MKNNPQNKETFFIYDYETFGIHPALDRPAQFSGIRTDINFQTLDTIQTSFCRLPNDYLPNPHAVLITEINPLESLNKGINESKFAQYIQKIFSVPKTCILGYNNNHFDDEFSRNIFYRNFYDPYDWSWKNKNSSWDLLHVAYACYMLRPEGIQWPINKMGLPSFRLQDLSKINNIEHYKIHDATSDVYATLELAKLIKKTQPKLFEYFYKHRTKQAIKQLINIYTMEPLVYIPTNTYYKQYITWISPLIWHPKNPNILIGCDLNNNMEILQETNFNILINKLSKYSYQKKKTIFQLININKSPILTPINILRNKDINRLNINPQNLLNNFKKLKQYIFTNKNLIKMIQSLYKQDYHSIQNKNTNLHIDTQLYNGFFNNIDRQIITNIRNSTPEKLAKINIYPNDSRIKSLLFFYRARNFSYTLNNDEKNNWINYRKKIFTQKTFVDYTQQINTLHNIHKKNKKKIILLNTLTQYLKNIYTNLNK